MKFVYSYVILGPKVKEIREKLNISQRELAKEIGVTQSHICYIENGLRQTTVQILCNICNVLGCRPDDLLFEKFEEEPEEELEEG